MLTTSFSQPWHIKVIGQSSPLLPEFPLTLYSVQLMYLFSSSLLDGACDRNVDVSFHAGGVLSPRPLG